MRRTLAALKSRCRKVDRQKAERYGQAGEASMMQAPDWLSDAV